MGPGSLGHNTRIRVHHERPLPSSGAERNRPTRPRQTACGNPGASQPIDCLQTLLSRNGARTPLGWNGSQWVEQILESFQSLTRWSTCTTPPLITSISRPRFAAHHHPAKMALAAQTRATGVAKQARGVATRVSRARVVRAQVRHGLTRDGGRRSALVPPRTQGPSQDVPLLVDSEFVLMLSLHWADLQWAGLAARSRAPLSPRPPHPPTGPRRPILPAFCVRARRPAPATGCPAPPPPSGCPTACPGETMVEQRQWRARARAREQRSSPSAAAAGGSGAAQQMSRSRCSTALLCHAIAAHLQARGQHAPSRFADHACRAQAFARRGRAHTRSEPLSRPPVPTLCPAATSASTPSAW